MEKLTARIEKWIIDLIDRATTRPDRDVGVWQRQIERRFTLELEIDSNRFSLYDGTRKTASFVWANIVEIQSLRRKDFPPLMWNIVTESGSWLVPNGGTYAEALTDRIYALTGYHTQQVVKLSPPPGYNSASSMWRKDDHCPKLDFVHLRGVADRFRQAVE
jgi:hypothetical protein